MWFLSDPFRGEFGQCEVLFEVSGLFAPAPLLAGEPHLHLGHKEQTLGEAEAAAGAGRMPGAEACSLSTDSSSSLRPRSS